MSKFYEFYKTLNKKERLQITHEAASAFAKFLDSLRIDWQNDPESVDTPMRVAKMYVNDLLQGRFIEKPKARNIKLEQGSSLALKIFGPIAVKSVCIHHCMPFIGSIIIGISSVGSEKNMLGISKYSEICNWYARRGQIQEMLGDDILNELAGLHKVADVSVFIKAQHSCFSHTEGGDCCSKLYTVHATDNFPHYKMFVSSCMQMV